MLSLKFVTPRRLCRFLPLMHVNQTAWKSIGTQPCVNGFSIRTRLDIPAQASARIAGRKWLPGSTFPGNNLPEHLASPRENMPAVYEVIEEKVKIEEWSSRCREIIDEKLHVYGTILFRGLPVENADEFSRLFKNLGYTSMTYQGGAGERTEKADQVTSATDIDPPIYSIEPHNEMAYTDHGPLKVFLYCDVPAKPGRGGESGITYVRDTLRNLDPKVVQKFDKLGLKYCYHSLSKNSKDAFMSWQGMFRTEDKAVVEQYMKDHNCEYKWLDNDDLSYWRYGPAFANHPITGERVWFNQATTGHASYYYDHPMYADKNLPENMYPIMAYYGDGSVIKPEVLQHIRDVLWQGTVGFQLQKGDVLVYDNFYAQHSRLGFDCERTLLFAMTSD
ncbi:dapdiamide synthesis protein DdaC-like isoform X1 [Ptychodera flava]|uniref:dapdiamide synthesis protein DdaC-like isoform X1 n=1 Tax=Ptychodera flava TaxID=63121 RepID=UPI003969F2BD